MTKKKILIVKSSALGDIVHAFPAIGFIKDKFPDATIDWVVERPFVSLVASHPAVSRAIAIDTKNWRKGLFSSNVRKEISKCWQSLRQEHYDVIFDLQANTKSGIITALARGNAKVGYTWSGVSEWPNLLCTTQRIDVPKGISVRDDYLCLVQSYFDCSGSFHAPTVLKLSVEEEDQLSSYLKNLKALNMPLVMVCHGSNWKNKQLTLEVLSEFLHLLQQHLNCHFLFTWGSSNEKTEAALLQKQFEQSAIVEKFSLSMLQHLMAEMQLVVAMDSLPLHLAATTSVPTFSVFGPSLAVRYAPTGLQNHAFQGSCPYGRKFATRCPILRTCKTGACIRSLSGQQLFEAYLKK